MSAASPYGTALHLILVLTVTVAENDISGTDNLTLSPSTTSMPFFPSGALRAVKNTSPVCHSDSLSKSSN